MIARLRARHRCLVSGLAVLLPALALAGWNARRPPEVMESLPAALSAPEPAHDGGPVLTAEIGGIPLSLRGGERASVAFGPSPRAHPDLLVLWSSQQPAGSPPEGSRFLGKLGEDRRVFGLPPEATRGEGWLLLYSLAHAELAGTLPLARLPAP